MSTLMRKEFRGLFPETFDWLEWRQAGSPGWNGR